MRRSLVLALRAFGPPIAATGALALALQSCGVMSSISDCQERADCPEEATLRDGTVPSFDAAEASNSGDDGALDQEVGADAFEASLDADATGDAIDSAASVVDAADAADARRDASQDVVTEDVVSEDVGPRDTCLPTEICTNGVDDNCDGKIDCADPECSGYRCAIAVPTGWVGPALFWTGAAGATAPTCPSGYQDAFDANAGPTGTAGTCSCTCTATGQVCSTTGQFMSALSCAGPCRTVTVDSSGSCATATTAMTCGMEGSFSAPTPAPSGGSCSPQVTMTSGTPAGWTTSARVCTWAGAVDSPGGCGVATDQCVAAPVAPFGTTYCVYQSGAVACPAGYTNQNIVYSNETDGRGCTACTCGATISGGSCSGSIALYGDGAAGCNGTPPATYNLGTTSCFTYNGLSLQPGFAKANFTVTPGTCSVTAQPQPMGAVTGSGAITVCCF